MKHLGLLLGLLLLLPACGNNSAPDPDTSDNTTGSDTSTAVIPEAAHHCVSTNGLPDKVCTPGVTNPAVTQDNIKQTICKSGWTSTVRPPVSYTNPLKIQGIADYGYTDHKLSDYEEDHLIPLELGGSPTDPHNLWPEPSKPTNTGFHVKDLTENRLKSEVCAGTITLAAAQTAIATNWETVP